MAKYVISLNLRDIIYKMGQSNAYLTKLSGTECDKISNEGCRHNVMKGHKRKQEELVRERPEPGQRDRDTTKKQ